MNEDQLLAGLKRNEPEAVEALVNLHGNRLLRSAFLLCGNEMEAQDLAQETFVQAVRSMQRFRGQSGIYTWLHAILLNLVRHHRRKQHRLVYGEETAALELVSVEESLSASDTSTASSALQRALGQLSEAHRVVIVLRFYEDMKLQDISRHLGVSEGTVKSRLHHAIGQMQRLMPAEMNLFGANDTK